MDIVEISKIEVDKIKPLWESLNETHHDKFSHWKKHFSKQTFEKRFQDLLKEQNSYILVAKGGQEIIAYIFS